MNSFTLVLEGGGMRGTFSAGVLDYFQERNIEPELTIGVSAGAIHGLCLKSKQPGTSLKVVLDYANDPRYLSKQNLVKSGEIFNLDFLFEDIFHKYVPFDYDAFAKNPMRMIAVSTNMRTGLPTYNYVVNMRQDYPYVQASSSLPIVGKARQIGDDFFMDGGVSDSIPIKFAMKQKNEKIVVVTTQEKSYRKEKDPSISMFKLIYHKYPKFVETMENRHIVYNETLDLIDQLEEEGKIFVIRPKEKLPVGRVEKDADKLQAAYDEGIEEAMLSYQSLMEYLK